MTREEYLNKLGRVTIDKDDVSEVERVYDHALPAVLKQMLSLAKKSIFFDDGFRTLSIAEVIDARADLHVDFQALGLIPVIDCGDNDFIVYHIRDNVWSKYNIVDEVVFKKRAQLEDLFA